MIRQAMVGSLLAMLATVGCATTNSEKSQSQALTYTGSFSHGEATNEAAPRAEAQRGPRLQRKAAEPSSAGGDRTTEATTTPEHGLAIGGGPRSTIEPSNKIPSPPPTVDFPPHAGVEAALRAVPTAAPAGTLNRDALEAPIRDRVRYDRCRIPKGTRVRIDAVVYNGNAVGVDVRSTPGDQALEFCVEQIVREASWVQEPAVNRVSLML